MSGEIWVVADLHLQKGAWLHSRVVGDSLFALKQIADLCAAERPAAVLLAGDVLDKRTNSSDIISELIAQSNKIVASGAVLGYIQGQHEKSYPPWMSVIRSAIHLDRRVQSINGVKVAGLDWRPASEAAACLKEVPLDVDVLIMHQSWVELVGTRFQAELSFSDVPEHIPLVVSGDLHRKDFYLKNDRQLISPGATCMQDISEPKCHFFAIIGSDGKFKNWRMLKSRLVVDYKFYSEQEIEQCICDLPDKVQEWRSKMPDLPEELQKPLVRIKIENTFSNLDKLLREMRVHAHPVVIRQKPHKGDTDSFTESQLVQGNVTTLSDLLPEFIENRNSYLYLLATTLLDPTVVTAQAVNEWRDQAFERQ